MSSVAVVQEWNFFKVTIHHFCGEMSQRLNWKSRFTERKHKAENIEMFKEFCKARFGPEFLQKAIKSSAVRNSVKVKILVREYHWIVADTMLFLILMKSSKMLCLWRMDKGLQINVFGQPNLWIVCKDNASDTFCQKEIAKWSVRRQYEAFQTL